VALNSWSLFFTS